MLFGFLIEIAYFFIYFSIKSKLEDLLKLSTLSNEDET